jgi:hypothetical protein
MRVKVTVMDQPLGTVGIVVRRQTYVAALLTTKEMVEERDLSCALWRSPMTIQASPSYDTRGKVDRMWWAVEEVGLTLDLFWLTTSPTSHSSPCSPQHWNTARSTVHHEDLDVERRKCDPAQARTTGTDRQNVLRTVLDYHPYAHCVAAFR